MARLTLSFLGPFEVSLDGQPARGFETVKARALLAYLADDPGRKHTRSHLAGLLWPDRPESSALSNLRHTLANLRDVIGDREAQPPYLSTNRETISFNPSSQCDIDTDRFTRLLENEKAVPDPGCMEQAAALYRGDFLEGFGVEDSPNLEEWILVRREEYRSKLLDTLYDLSEGFLANHDYERAIVFGRRQIVIEPCCEEAHRQVMTALVGMGRVSEALAQYEACRKSLAEELGAEPSRVTRQLNERIQNGGVEEKLEAGILPGTQIHAQRQHNLPRSLTSFIGRQEEIAQVKQLLKDHCLVTLTGAGGVGKSRLALAVASELVEDYRDGVWLVELAAINSQNQVASAVAQAIGLGAGPVQPTMGGLIAFFHTRQLLLILDNCEHLIDACSDLAYELLQACPALKVLITSREKLDLDGEVAYRVPSLAFPNDASLPSIDAAQEFSALQLFSDRALAVRLDFKVTKDNIGPVSMICRQLDGIPLALELAASRLDVLTEEQLAVRLEKSLSILSRGDRATLPRHQTLRATIDWSYQLLSPKERLLLERLSVFTGGWTLEAAEEVCAGEGICAEEVFGLMAGLIHKSMVVQADQANADVALHFRLLETIRQYAQEKLLQGGMENILHSRHCSYFGHLAEKARPRLQDGQHLQWMNILDAERENLFSAITWAIDEENDIPRGLRFLCRLDRWWPLRGYLIQGIRWLRKGLATWKGSEGELAGLYVEVLCLLAHAEPNRETAISLIDQALERSKGLGPKDQFEHARTLYTAGYLYNAWYRDGQTAVAYLDQSLQMFKEIVPDDIWVQALIMDEKSSALLNLGNLDEASILARESRRKFLATGDHWFANPLRVLGIIAMRQKNFQEAEMYFKESLEQRMGVEDAWLLGELELLGIIERQQGHYEKALSWLREAIRRSSEYYFYYLAIEFFRYIAFTEIICSRNMELQEGERHLLHAARLLGAAEAGQAIEWLKLFVYPTSIYPEYIEELHHRLDPCKLDIAWDEGSGMEIDQATHYALTYS